MRFQPLVRFQEGVEILGHFGAGPILAPHNLAIDVASAIDDVRIGKHGGAVVERGFARWIHRGREVDIVSLEEIGVRGRIVIHADTQHRAAARSDLLLQLNQRRSFVHAGWAPTRPEIQDHDFPAEIGKMGGVAVEREREVFRGLPMQARFTLPIVRMGENRHQACDKDECDAGAEIAF